MSVAPDETLAAADPGTARREAAIGAALARAGGGLRNASLTVGLVAAWLAIRPTFIEPGWRPPVGDLVFLGEVLLLALGQWLGLRLTLDADLFADLVRDPNLAGFDAAMTGLRLMPKAKAGRSMAARIAGVRRLARLLGLVLAVQVALLVGFLLFGVV